MLIIKIIILLISLLILLYITKNKKSVLLLPVAFVFLHLMRDRVDLRPEIFSYLFTAITYSILERFNRLNSKLIYLLPLVTLLWVNTHIFFPVGLFIQAIFAIDLIIKKFIKKINTDDMNKKLRILLIVFLSSIIATLFNPNFIKGALYPFTVFSNYGVSIVENEPIFVQAGRSKNSRLYIFLSLDGNCYRCCVYKLDQRKSFF